MDTSEINVSIEAIDWLTMFYRVKMLECECQQKNSCFERINCIEIAHEAYKRRSEERAKEKKINFAFCYHL